jgi:heat shock protein HslJ
MMSRPRTTQRLSVLVFAVVACSAPGEREVADSAVVNAETSASASETAIRASLGREWELARLGSQVIPPSVARDPRIPAHDPHPGMRPTIRFASDPSGAGGRSFCNAYGGPWRLAGDSLQITRIESTAVGCDGPDSLETRFFRGLRETRRFAFVGDTLVLIASDGTRLQFVPVAPATRAP